MSTKRLIALLLFGTCMASCASAPAARLEKTEKQYSSRDNWITVYSTGIRSISGDTGFVVESLEQDSPAQQAGLQPGDVIVSINGKPMTQKDQEILTHWTAGDGVITISASRNGVAADYKVKPVKRFKWPPSAGKLHELLLDNRRVSLALFVAEVRSESKESRGSDEMQKQQWHDFINKHVLKEFGQNKNLTVVNTRLMYNTFERNKFDFSGPIPEESRTVISKQTGATHLLVASLSRLFDDTGGQVDIAAAKLIDLLSGNELAFDQRVDCKQSQ